MIQGLKIISAKWLIIYICRRSGIHNRQLTFFRPSEYISQDFKQYGSNAKDKVESKLGAGVKDRFKDEEIYKDRDAQIKAIEKTFKDVQQDVSEHYSKKDVHAVEVLPLLPDFETWKHPCAQVQTSTLKALLKSVFKRSFSTQIPLQKATPRKLNWISCLKRSSEVCKMSRINSSSPTSFR